MRRSLLKKQPTWGLRRAQGTGQKSTTPATLTKVILVLLTMFLIPSAAWGQWDTKTFNFHGCTDDILYATDPNVANMDYCWYYRNSNGYGASLVEEKVKISVGDGLGKSVLTPPSDYTIKKVTLNYSYLEVTGESKIYVRAVNRTDTTTHYTDPYLMTSDGSLDINLNDEGISSDNLSFLIFSNDDKAYSYYLNSITITKIADYNLSIGGVPLTGSNVNPETGAVTDMDGFYFTPAVGSTPATLTLNDANFGPSLKGIVWSGNGTLKIQYSGNNIINTRNGSELNAGSDDGYCILGKSSSILILSASNAASTLTLKPSTGGTPESNNSRAAISGFTDVQIDKTNGWGMYYTDDYSDADPENPTAGEEVVLLKDYLGIAVAGVPVTSSNANEITGDHISGSVSFDSEEKILTLNGATIDLSDNNGYPVVSSIENLTVKLIGKNEATLYTDCPNFIKYSGESSSAQLTFETEWSSDEYGKYSLGDLTINDAESAEIIAYGYTISNSLEQSASYIDPDNAGGQTSGWKYSIIESPKSVKVWYLKVYDLWIGSGRVISTALEAGQSGGFSYDPVKELLPATSTNNYPIKSSMEELVISVKGPNCGITPSSSTCAITFQSTDEQPSGKLKFVVAEGAEENMNKFTIRNDGGAISGFSSVTFEDPLKLNTPATTPTTWDASTTNVVISDEIFYDLWVMGQQVTSANASDIFGAAQSSQTVPAIFDAEESTLTLNGLQLSNSTTYPTCIESGLESLTVTLSGDNKFQKGGDVTTLYGFKAQDGKTCNITFTASEEESFSFMAEAEAKNAISGFSKVTYKDDLVAYMSEGNFYISEDIYLNFNTVYDNDYPTGVRIITSGLNADIVSHKIAYTIDYAKEDMEDVPETEYTGVIPLATITAGPCTVTAYTLSLDGENTKSNNIKGCYFQYTESEVIIGNGSTIDLMDYLLPALAGEEEVSFDNTSSQSGTIISISEEDNTITGIAYGTASVISTVGGEFTTFNQTLEPDEFTLSISITVQDIIGESTFASGQSYGTFYNTDQAYKVPEGVLKAYIIKSVDEEKGEIVTEETSVLPPSTPVLLFRTSTSGSANYVFTKVSGVEPANTELKYTTTEKEAVETSKLYVLYNGQFVKVTANTMIPANHCYLDLATTAGTRGFYNIGGGEGTTAISKVISEGVNSEKLADGEWYTLQGQRVAKPAKGLYILNGKKVVVK